MAADDSTVGGRIGAWRKHIDRGEQVLAWRLPVASPAGRSRLSALTTRWARAADDRAAFGAVPNRCRSNRLTRLLSMLDMPEGACPELPRQCAQHHQTGHRRTVGLTGILLAGEETAPGLAACRC